MTTVTVLNTRASITTLEEQERAAYLLGDIEKAELIRQLIIYKRRVLELEETIQQFEDKYHCI